MTVSEGLRRFRSRQIRLCSRFFCRLGRTRIGRAAIINLRRVPGLPNLLIGYRRPFPSLESASKAVEAYENGGHQNPLNSQIHLSLAEHPRPSDYAALFHIGKHSTNIGRVFDLGGNVGNLYYMYTKWLSFAPNLTWTVQDLPANIARGREIASQRAAAGLAFTSSAKDAEAADLFIASGCLHYFSSPLYEMIAALETKPSYVLLNRTPMTDHAGFATIQDASAFHVPCMLYNRDQIIQGMAKIGYRLVDRWDAHELSVDIPLFPDLSVPAYTGMFFEKTSPSTA